MSDADTSSADLLRKADTAMYAAKAAGRGQVVAFRQELLDTASARSELAALLRGAESRDELQLHFQPVVNLDDGSTVGVEALVRWQPDGHLLHLPADFIELAEETGEILPIGRWVIAEGCRRVRAWQTRYDMPGLRLYVNLSARQFRDPGLVPMIVSALARTGLDAGSLTLEITEGTLLIPGFETVQRIGELRALGLRLAIDDFGTGYSSLGYLHAFQIDELKIDRSFVPGGEGVGDAHVLSQAIVELGRALGLDMIAEGIETKDQADWFRTLGCRMGQGFLYARPMSADDLDRYLRSDHPDGRRRGRSARSRHSRLAARGPPMPGSPTSSERAKPPADPDRAPRARPRGRCDPSQPVDAAPNGRTRASLADARPHEAAGGAPPPRAPRHRRDLSGPVDGGVRRWVHRQQPPRGPLVDGDPDVPAR